MTNERTQAYGRVVQTLDEIGATKLLPAEQARIRDAADTLIFASDLDEARDALRDMGVLAEHLLASGRWLEERIDLLVANLLGLRPLERPRRGLDGGVAAIARAADAALVASAPQGCAEHAGSPVAGADGAIATRLACRAVLVQRGDERVGEAVDGLDLRGAGHARTRGPDVRARPGRTGLAHALASCADRGSAMSSSDCCSASTPKTTSVSAAAAIRPAAIQ